MRSLGVSSPSFVANMCVKQNAIDYASQYPLAAAAVDLSFYVDNGADSAEDAIELQTQFHNLFLKCGFLLRNGIPMSLQCWNMLILISKSSSLYILFLMWKNTQKLWEWSGIVTWTTFALLSHHHLNQRTSPNIHSC